MKTIEIVHSKFLKNGDRVIKLMLSSFFMFFLMIFTEGCAEEPVMYIKEEQEAVENIDNNELLQEVEEDTVTVAETQPKVIYIHICGAVKHEGVYEMAEQSRLIDAIERAGGLTEEACADAVNQAAVLYDEQYIYIPTKDEVGSNDQAGVEADNKLKMNVGSQGMSGDDKVNINNADVQVLMTLTGIGEVKAKSIIEYRESNGRFESCEEIKKVKGIGEASYQKIKDEITVR